LGNDQNSVSGDEASNIADDARRRGMPVTMQPPEDGQPHTFFGCEVRKGKSLVLPSMPGRALVLKQAALGAAANGSTSLLIKTASQAEALVLCTMRTGCEQCCITAVLDSSDAATLELAGAGASVHVCGTRAVAVPGALPCLRFPRPPRH
jgi:hypothetical protein